MHCVSEEKKSMQCVSNLDAIDEKIKQIFSMDYRTEEQKKQVLNDLKKAVQELERTYLNISKEANALNVKRAIIIGRICTFVKRELLHGQWTDWAEDNFEEDIRTVQKFMAIGEFPLAEEYAHLGTEKVYQLSRIKHLLKEGKETEILFEDAGQSPDFEDYSVEEMKKAVNIILNKECLKQKGIEISTEALVRLTENFNLISLNSVLLSKLVEEKAVGANMEKVVDILVSSGAGRSAVKSKKVMRKEEINQALEKFIAALQYAINHEEPLIEEARLFFAEKLIEEYLKKRNRAWQGGDGHEDISRLSSGKYNYRAERPVPGQA